MEVKVTPADASKVEDYDWGRITWLVSGPLGNSRSMTFGRVTFNAGRSNPDHQHPNCDEILHLLSGRLEHVVGRETCVLNPGDTISVPSGVLHHATAVGGQPAVAVIAFSSADRETRGR